MKVVKALNLVMLHKGVYLVVSKNTVVRYIVLAVPLRTMLNA